VFVLGASTGGIECLCEVLRGLDTPNAIVAVVHRGRGDGRRVHTLLSYFATQKIVHAFNEQAVLPGRIYLASPSEVMRLHATHIETAPVTDERANRLDPLFASAAAGFGPRVVAVLLSGVGEDGMRGLSAVRAARGVVIVQSPADAAEPDAPSRAIRLGYADRTVKLAEIGPLLQSLASGSSVAR